MTETAKPQEVSMLSSSPIFLDAETDGLKPSKVWVVVTMQDDVLQYYDSASLQAALEGDGYSRP